jgi:hypothetical protein
MCMSTAVPAVGAGELLSWDLAHLPPQAHKRYSGKAYESGDDSEEGSDGEGPIFKGGLQPEGC